MRGDLFQTASQILRLVDCPGFLVGEANAGPRRRRTVFWSVPDNRFSLTLLTGGQGHRKIGISRTAPVFFMMFPAWWDLRQRRDAERSSSTIPRTACLVNIET